MSFKHLVVPLDGSHLAEAVLPTASVLAQVLQARVTLLHIIERNPPQEIHGETHLTSEQQALTYLQQIAAEAFPDDVEVNYHIHTAEVSDVAKSIVDHASELDTDMVAMCTHGRSGLRGFLFGSIAQQVVAMGKSPVLLIQPGRDGTAPAFQCLRLLVPLDGNPDHEQALEVAISLAQACGAELHLLAVVHTMGSLPGEQAASAMLLPGTASAVLDMNEQNAGNYLLATAKSYIPDNVSVQFSVLRGDPARGIAKAARQQRANLIVLGTHGKSSMDAFWSGSLTPRIARSTRIPLLMVPVENRMKQD